MSARPVRAGDAAAVAALLNEHSRRLHGEAEVTEAEVEHWWSDPEVEAWTAPGAYADLQRDAGRTRFWLDPRGEPSRLVLEAAERRAAELAAPGAVLRAVVDGEDEPMRELFEGAGYRVVRSSFRMRVDLAAEPEPPSLPEGVELRPGTPADARLAYELYVDAFADAWDFHAEPFEEWRRWHVEAPAADPSLWLLAAAGGDPAGVCLAGPHQSGEPAAGWISILGVRRPHRGHGLGHALLRAAFGALYRRRRRVVELGVDAGNETGAVALYERAGMRVSRRSDTWEKRLGGAAP